MNKTEKNFRKNEEKRADPANQLIVDAIREMLGYKPLYALEKETDYFDFYR